MGPLDFFRSRLDNLQAHPFQSLAGTALGAIVPGGGLAANAFFNRYNNNQFNNAANQSYANSQALGDQSAERSLNRPLNGPLALVSGLSDFSGPDKGPTSQDRQLMDAIGGGGGNGGGYSGGGYQPIGGWSPATMSGWNPNQASASQAFGLLDFLGPNFNQPFDIPTTPTAHSPQDRRDAANSPLGPSANYGVSNFMVGGTPVITGMDPNQMVFRNGSRNLY